MEIKLYQCSDSHDTINKTKILIDTFPIIPKRQTNILNPQIKLKIEGIRPTIDYAYIDGYNRYYHVVNVEPKPNNIYYLFLEVDVLETYKEDILNMKKIVYDNKVNPTSNIVESNITDDQTTSYIISTIGGEDNG